MSSLTISGTMWRALRTELLRSVAPPAAVVTLVLSAQAIFASPGDWSGRWMALAAEVRMSLLILAPVAVAFGAWQGGRDRRRRVDEQLDGAPRPRWHPVIIGWLGVTLGCWLGLLISVGVAAAFVAPIATYAGGGWGWLLGGGFVSLAAISAVGIALGRLVPFRLTGPVAAVSLYSLQIYAHDDSGMLHGFEYLAPIQPLYDLPGTAVDGRFMFEQMVWFVGLAATMLVLAGARQRLVAILPATIAVGGAMMLINGQPFWPWPWQPDPTASELVCTHDEPEVCLPRAEAFVLDDVTPVARDVIERLDGLPGAPVRAEDHSYDLEHSPPRTLSIDPILTITGELNTEVEWNLVHWGPPMDCHDIDDVNRYDWMASAVRMWATDFTEPWADDRAHGALTTLQSMSDVDRKAWVGEFIAAARECDTDVLDQLTEALA